MLFLGISVGQNLTLVIKSYQDEWSPLTFLPSMHAIKAHVAGMSYMEELGAERDTCLSNLIIFSGEQKGPPITLCVALDNFNCD